MALFYLSRRSEFKIDISLIERIYSVRNVNERIQAKDRQFLFDRHFSSKSGNLLRVSYHEHFPLLYRLWSYIVL